MNKRVFTTVVLMVTFVLPVAIASTERSSFKSLYDQYFPKNSEYVTSFYRRGFDDVLNGPPPNPGDERHPVYYATRGNPAAFHAFVHHSDRSGGGEFAETWNHECLFLLLRLGDDRFSELLASEDRKTREAVGMAVDSQVDWTKHRFPKTRALYSFRWRRSSSQEMQKRHVSPYREACVNTTPDEALRLKAALATDLRFSGVQVYTTHRKGRTPTIIAAPRTLSRSDFAKLETLVRKYVEVTGAIKFD